MKNKKLIIGLMAIILLGVGYYAIEYRPQQLRMRCWELSKDAATTRSTIDGGPDNWQFEEKSLGRGSGAEKAYDDCLRSQNIKRYSLWENLNLF